MLKKVKRKEGITLIALIITIIVLLILVGITISMISSQDGILDKVVEGKQKYKEATELEKLKIATQSALIDGNGVLEDENIKKELKETFGEGNYDYLGDGLVIINEKYYKISEDGTAEIEYANRKRG